MVNDITNPTTKRTWKIEDDIDGTLEDAKLIAEKFNNFFVTKIENLKANIDSSIKEDPLQHLAKKMENKNLKFALKTVTVKAVKKAMKEMRKKKSSGRDNVTQECLLNGMDVLAEPLTHIINASIASGVVPDHWKEAVVVPILIFFLLFF